MGENLVGGQGRPRFSAVQSGSGTLGEVKARASITLHLTNHPCFTPTWACSVCLSLSLSSSSRASFIDKSPTLSRQVSEYLVRPQHQHRLPSPHLTPRTTLLALASFALSALDLSPPFPIIYDTFLSLGLAIDCIGPRRTTSFTPFDFHLPNRARGFFKQASVYVFMEACQ